MTVRFTVRSWERTEFGAEVSDGDRIAFDHEGFEQITALVGAA